MGTDKIATYTNKKVAIIPTVAFGCHRKGSVLEKFFALLIVMSLLLSVPCFGQTAFAEAAACPFLLNVVGSGNIEYSGGDLSSSISRRATVNFARGDNITLTATPNSSSEFLYWVNSETERIISYNTVFSTTAATYMNLEAVFNTTLTDYHYVCYLTLAGKILKGGAFRNERIVLPPDAPSLDGYSFVKWEYSLTDISTSTGNMFIYPIYEVSRDNCVITVTKYGNTETQEYTPFSTATVSATGNYMQQQFLYWQEVDDETDETEIVSYYSTYNFVAIYDTHLEAVYGDPVTAQPVIRLTGDSPEFEQGRLTFYSERSIPEGYTVVQHGIIVTKNHSLANSQNGSGFIIGAANVGKGTSTNYALAGSYSLMVTSWPKETTANGETVTVWPIIYARAFLIVRDAHGNLLDTIYSRVHTADYLSMGYMGEVDDNNFDDPF